MNWNQSTGNIFVSAIFQNYQTNINTIQMNFRYDSWPDQRYISTKLGHMQTSTSRNRVSPTSVLLTHDRAKNRQKNNAHTTSPSECTRVYVVIWIIDYMRRWKINYQIGMNRSDLCARTECGPLGHVNMFD